VEVKQATWGGFAYMKREDSGIYTNICPIYEKFQSYFHEAKSLIHVFSRGGWVSQKLEEVLVLVSKTNSFGPLPAGHQSWDLGSGDHA